MVAVFIPKYLIKTVATHPRITKIDTKEEENVSEAQRKHFAWGIGTKARRRKLPLAFIGYV